MNQKPPVHSVLRNSVFRLPHGGKLAAGILGICIVILIAMSGDVYAVQGDDSIRMEVVYGYNNAAKGGRYLPVGVSLVNPGDQEFNGKIRMKTTESDGTIYLYEYELSLAADSQEVKQYYIPIGYRADQLHVSLLDEQREVHASQQLRLSVSTDVTELFIGILSDTPERLSYLDGSGVNYGSLRTHTFSMNADQFPEEEIGLDLLDVILVTNYRLRNLSEKQTAAIMDWASSGGVLILGTGERVDDTLGRFAPELLDNSYGTPQLREIDMGMEYATDIPGEHFIEMACVDIPLHGGNVISSSEEFPLLTAATRGRGLIAVAAYDFIDIEDFCRQNPSYVDQMFTALLGTDRIEQIAGMLYSGNTNKFWSVQGLINTGDVDRLPNLALYVTVICVYLLILGPGLYLGLRRCGMQDYYRRGVLIVSCMFAVIIYLMGTRTRFNGTFYNYASIQDVTEDYVTDTTYLNIRNPYNTSYRVELDPTYSVLPITRSYYDTQLGATRLDGEDDYHVAIRNKQESTVINAQNVVSFTPKYFQLRSKYDNNDNVGIKGDIALFGDQLSGTITNGYDFAIDDTTILFYGKMIYLSSMAAGETRDLEDAEIINIPVNHPYAIAEEITGESGFSSADIDNTDYLRALERTNLLAFYLENYMTSYNADARVIAFSSKKEETEFLKDRTGETYGLTMLTSSIAVDSYDGNYLYRSALMKAPLESAGVYSAGTNSISTIDPVTIEYSLGNDIKVEAFALEPLSDLFSRNRRSRYLVPFEGSIYLLNHETRSYDLFEAEDYRYTQEELTPYLSPGNTLTVRYVYNGTRYSNIVLPMPTVVGKEK